MYIYIYIYIFYVILFLFLSRIKLYFVKKPKYHSSIFLEIQRTVFRTTFDCTNARNPKISRVNFLILTTRCYPSEKGWYIRTYNGDRYIVDTRIGYYLMPKGRARSVHADTYVTCSFDAAASTNIRYVILCRDLSPARSDLLLLGVSSHRYLCISVCWR